MLLITRREGEAIVINGTITVQVLEVRGGRVKLGFEFPAGNTVYREELYAKIQAENRAAALPATGNADKPLSAVLKGLQEKLPQKQSKGKSDATSNSPGDDPDDHQQ